MNTAVIINSRHLSRWRRSGLTSLSFWSESSDPDLHKCIYVCPKHSWSSFIYRRSEYEGFCESLQITFPNNVLVSQFSRLKFSMLHRYIYLRYSYIGLFYGPWYVSRPLFFGTVCESLSALTVCVYTASYIVCNLWIFIDIMVNARGWRLQRIWSGRIGNLWKRGGVSRAH